MNKNQQVLEVKNLKTHFFTRAGVVKAVNDISFSVDKGEVLGLVGESGSGKSVMGFSILGLVDPPGRVVGGEIIFNGENIAQFSDKQMQQLRGKRIAMIFQDPMMTLNPVLRIDTQMIEAIRTHENIDKRTAYERACEGLALVGIPSPQERMSAYPHQFSGGMRQRVAIAIAMLNKPDLIIADEPTTALDVTIQAQILHQMQKICRESGMSLIWITHDLSVVAGLAKKISVMYSGRIVENGPIDDVLDRPCHPYTHGLIQSVPSRNRRGKKLYQISGTTPSLLNISPGCAFRSRCERQDQRCLTSPPGTSMMNGRQVYCWHPYEDEGAKV